jgi:hypothetical protein
VISTRQCWLERHSQRELEDARVAGGGDSPEVDRTAIAVGQTQVDVVQCVEGFEAELDFETLNRPGIPGDSFR